MSEQVESEGKVRTWRYSRWSGAKATVVAHGIEFCPTHIVWLDRDGRVVLAERPEQVNELAEVGTLGSATRGVRPEEEAS